MMHRLTALRKTQQRNRAAFEGQSNVRPILTGTARRGYTPSDLESLEAVAIPSHANDGSFLPLAGYDDVEAVQSYP